MVQPVKRKASSTTQSGPSTPPKKKPERRKYLESWENEPRFSGWVQKDPDGEDKAYCKWCRCKLRPHANGLTDHASSKKHNKAKQAVPAVSNQRALDEFGGFKPKNREGKEMDLKLSAHVASHSSVRTIDHLGEVLISLGFKGEKFKDLKLHRTKCSKIICNILAPCMLKELLQDIGDSWYSIIVDESTDTTAVKYMALMVRYFSFQREVMVIDFLGLVETPQATADKLYASFKGFMESTGLGLSRLLALGTDGGANLCGANHSLYALLKRYDCSNLHLVKCICHSLDKCSSKASACLPGEVEFLLRESRNWFSHSALRKMQYAELYKSIGAGDKPPHLVKLATTRWLSWHGAVQSHANQYNALQTLFREMYTKDNKCIMAKTLAEMHEDKSNLMFLRFLKPLLKRVAETNLIYSDLKKFVFEIADMIIKPQVLAARQNGVLRLTELQALKKALLKQENRRGLNNVQYFDGFYQSCLELKIEEKKREELMDIFSDFLFEFTNELSERLPSCIEAVEQMSAFTPSIALSQADTRPKFDELPVKLIRDSALDPENISSQWKSLKGFKLREICPDEKDVNSVHIIKFWAGVWNVKNGAGQRVFRDLAFFVLSCLSLPLSNAVVERLFSILTIVKSKLRNKLGMEMLEAILRIRSHFQALGICCNSFVPTDDMVKLFCSKEMYGERRRPAKATSAEEDEQEVDNPDEEDLPVINFTDIESTVSIKEWDDMLDLLAEVDNMV